MTGNFDALLSRQNLAIGRAITLFRNAKDLTTQDLAVQSNIDFMKLRRIEKGRCSIAIEELARVTRSLNISNLEFLTIADGLSKRWRAKADVTSEGGVDAI